MEIPSPLTKEEICFLSPETQEIYKGLLDLDFSNHYAQYIDTFYNGVRVVLSELVGQLGRLAKVKGSAFTENKMRDFGAFFINSVIVKRNELVRDKTDTRQRLHRLSEGLEKVILDPRSVKVDEYTVSFDSKILRAKAQETIKLIKSDITKVPNYVNRSLNALAEFRKLQEEYEKTHGLEKYILEHKLRRQEAKVELFNSEPLTGEDVPVKDVRNGQVVEEHRFKGIETPYGFDGGKRL